MAPRKLTLAALVAVSCAALMAAGCGGGGSKSSSSDETTTASAAIQAPENIKSAGTLVYCTDATYPPEEYYQGSKIVGSDIDIGTDIAERMGVKARFDNTGFDGIIPALLSKKCDLIISGMNDTAERRQQVDFVDYLRVGQSFLVQKGNPDNITSITSLSGKVASVEVGTTNKDYLDQQNEKLKSSGKKPFQIVTFPKDTDAANALKTGRVDAYFADAPVALNYVDRDPSSFALGGHAVNPIPIGVAVRKGDAELRDAVQKAVDAMYADGTMKKIVAKWKMTNAVELLK